MEERRNECEMWTLRSLMDVAQSTPRVMQRERPFAFLLPRGADGRRHAHGDERNPRIGARLIRHLALSGVERELSDEADLRPREAIARSTARRVPQAVSPVQILDNASRLEASA
ncbi:hypothetical protein OVN20_05330 [Microcella daejeonensis]|uniref:hypothetical protein n=1 Tax=Microcella daejeonensis TaxID=2994971 RepID=UPI00226F9D61|nr:hypothetical protein [Microcella daejeonensis]WAB84974.1 hypothetical protein OVN20_05330 [Microcella daejeonensis]